MPKLENWYINNVDQIVGQVYGDTRFPDGTVIVTGRVAKWDGNKAVTKNTEYELGERRDDAPVPPLR